MGLLTKLKSLFASKSKKKIIRKIDLRKRFEILNKIGQGSMSKVHAARDREKGGLKICLKILDKEKTARFEERFKGLRKPSEGEISLELIHRNVVRTHEYGLTLQNEQWLLMELLDGVGLNYMVETRSDQLNGNILNFLIQMADGLEYLHKAGYLHRDICPRNVMVTRDNVVKYIDFGLTIPYTPDFCKPGNRTGTPNYLAPEVIKRQATDHRVDLFALGVTAYELVTGFLPWEGSRSLQTIRDHLNTPGRDPREFVPDLNEKVRKFLIKAVEREPRDRFQTPDEFREALKHLPKM